MEATRTEVLSQVANSSTETDANKQHALALAAMAAEDVAGRRKFFELREKWSKNIAIWISVLVAFNVVLTLLVGSGCLTFIGYEWFVTAVTVETFLQVVGMGYVAVRYLFSDGRSGHSN